MSSPKTPKSQPLAESPKIEDKAVQDAAAEAIARKKKQRGFRSTILSKDMMSDQTAAKLATLGS